MHELFDQSLARSRTPRRASHSAVESCSETDPTKPGRLMENLLIRLSGPYGRGLFRESLKLSQPKGVQLWYLIRVVFFRFLLILIRFVIYVSPERIVSFMSGEGRIHRGV